MTAIETSKDFLRESAKAFKDQGLTTHEIALKLQVSDRTVNRYIATIRKQEEAEKKLLEQSKQSGRSRKKAKKTKKSDPAPDPNPPLPPPIQPITLNPLSLLPSNIQTLIALGPTLKDIPSWMGPYILNKIDQLENTVQPKWTRPPIHHAIQNEVIDEICYGSKRVIMVDGSKRRGKSSTIFTAFCECQFNNEKYKRWFLYGATLENARKILRDIKQDPLFVEYTSPLYYGWGSSDKLVMYNQGRIEVMASGSERTTSGTDADLIWIDESHSVLIENPKTFAMAAMVLLANKNMKFIFTMNREGEAYEYFKNEMLNQLNEDEIGFYSFTAENCPHVSQEQDRLVRAIVNASAGAEYAAQYLDNQYIRENGLYYPTAKVQKAFESYDKPNLEQYDIIAAGTDWGDNHDTAICVMGFQGTEAFEEETVYLQHPTASEIVRVYTRLIREYPGIIFIWENSPLGSFARNEVRENFPKQRFIDSGFSKYKQSYIDNLYIWLVDEELHLKDPKLKRQLRSYVNDKKNDDGHDALAHVMYKAMAPRTQMKIKMNVVMRE